MKKLVLPLILILGGFTMLLQASTRVDLKLRVYEGARQGTLSPPKFITSSYIHSTITAHLQTSFDLEEEKSQIKRVFNLQDVNLLTEADLSIGVERAGLPSDSARHYFRLNGNAFMIFLRLPEVGPDYRFVVVFNEIIDNKPENVLTTSMLLHGGHSAIFGFEDRQGKPYFCSLRVTGPPDKVLLPPPPPPPPPPLPPELKKKLEELEKGAVKAWNTINPPRLIKRIDPDYPEAARKEGLEGSVSMAVRIDEKGNVKDVLILRSSNEIFNDAAVKAVKQWKYEPYTQDGEPMELVFSLTFRFTL